VLTGIRDGSIFSLAGSKRRVIFMSKAYKIFGLSVVGLLFCLFLASAQAQTSDIGSGDKDLLGVKSNSKSLGLLDPQRLKMYHSYTFSYLSLNYLHQPLSVFGRNDLSFKNSILPNFQLHYRPSNNFSLWINVLTFPSPYGTDSGYLRRGHER
jgi:hypothetical protein